MDIYLFVFTHENLHIREFGSKRLGNPLVAVLDAAIFSHSVEFFSGAEQSRHENGSKHVIFGHTNGLLCFGCGMSQ